MEWTLEIILVLLLAATLVQALRLERALGVLKRDRSALEGLVAGFNVSTNQAESGIQQLRAAAEGAGRQLDAQVTKSVALKDDLAFLTERGEKMADRIERLIKLARISGAEQKPATEKPTASTQMERDLLQTLRMAR
ncbi:MAG TPA: DUF6468 domain-containing protein [Rhodopila sp.]|nr:DUF6468 domain-containing protein [Rhodopila sp.]